MSDMTTITARQLARETSSVLSGLDNTPQGLIVTRDGEEVARLVPLSAVEREWRRELRARGVDPDRETAARPRPGVVQNSPVHQGLSAALAEARAAEAG